MAVLHDLERNVIRDKRAPHASDIRVVNPRANGQGLGLCGKVMLARAGVQWLERPISINLVREVVPAGCDCLAP